MSPDRLQAIFMETQGEWTERIALASLSEEDVVRLLDTQTYFDLLQIPYPSTRRAVLEKLAHDGLISTEGVRWSVTNLGALLFCKNARDFSGLSSRMPRVLVYQGNDKLSTVLDQQGLKGYAVGFSGLVDFVISQTPSNEIISDALRRETRMFPADALRELIANALVHQDFSVTGVEVRIEVYGDRIEISNPGISLIGTDRFIDEDRARNERLVDLMRRLGICERKGSGVDRVVAGAEVYQLPAPDFRVDDIRTTAVLFAKKEFHDMDRDDRIRACYQHACLRYVTNRRMTNQSLRERFKLTKEKSETVSRIIRDTTCYDKD
jgi:ATP-dependent DNA helicase RecG